MNQERFALIQKRERNRRLRAIVRQERAANNLRSQMPTISQTTPTRQVQTPPVTQKKGGCGCGGKVMAFKQAVDQARR
jgi:hypothetical protein